MRVSCDPNSKYWIPKPHYCDVFLDGERLLRCQEADEEGAWADVHVLDERGKGVFEGPTLKMERRYGRVEFRFYDRHGRALARDAAGNPLPTPRDPNWTYYD